MRDPARNADNRQIAKAQTNRRSASNAAPRGRSSSAPSDSPLTDSRLGRIIHVLSEHATLVISGTKLAQEIGSSRSEVWRLIQQLRGLGVEIEGHPAAGYQLKKVPDLPLPEILAPMLRGTIFAGHVQHIYRIGSTNAAAMNAAAQGAPEGSVLLAEHQTLGRGRGGHGWESPPSSGIYLSAILRPPLAPADVLVLSLAVGLSVARAVGEVTGLRVDLRWPNDLLLGGKKLCGILIELNAEVTLVQYAVVGIGVNVNQQQFPPQLREIATSLRIESGRTWSRVELTAALLKSLDREYRGLLTGAPGAVRDQIFRRFEQHSSSARGKRVQVEENGGFEGVTAGLDDRGFLRVETASGPRTVLSGGVREIAND
ncbi:MAG TPA: biotin--[acetyl-CoA-carboxylase] ligase [Terriglobales bacterium]|nr:biotin--[acetyl-CoA-carboxylase] ligase [Terriglobales bacterium]